MKTLIFAGFSAWCASFAGAQPIHHGFIWLEGPEGVLAPNTTYTMEAWGRWESPLFVQDHSAMAGFGFDVINTIGSGGQVASVSNVEFFAWDSFFAYYGYISGTSIYEVSGGQLPAGGILPIWPLIDLRNPIPLYTFDFTTADAVIEHLAFEPRAIHPAGGLSFYPDAADGASIVAPIDPDTELHLLGWEYFVPAPGGAGVLATGLCALSRRRR